MNNKLAYIAILFGVIFLVTQIFKYNLSQEKVLFTTTGRSLTGTVASEKRIREHFKKAMSHLQLKRIMLLLRVFVLQMESHNITYFPFAGTLLGINRHHGVIPWDDDLDFVIDTNKKPQLIAALKKLRPKYNLVTYEGNPTGKWKFYDINDTKIHGKPFRYPYVDIFFMREFSKTEKYVELYPTAKFRTNCVFPLIKRFFNGILVTTPCNIDHFLQRTVSLQYSNDCESASYNHSREEPVPSTITVKCDLLKKDFQFVERFQKSVFNKTLVEERLVQDGHVLQIVRYSVPRVCVDWQYDYPSDLEIDVYYN